MGASMVAVAAALLFVIALPVSADAQLRPPQSMSAEVEAARFRLRLDKETLETVIFLLRLRLQAAAGTILYPLGKTRE